MILRRNKYQLYLRTLTYLLPFCCFVFVGSAKVLISGTAWISSAAAYFELLLVTSAVWCVCAEWYRLCSVDDLFRQRTSMLVALGACSATYAAVGLTLYLVRQMAISRLFWALTAIVLWAATVAMRAAFRILIRRYSGRRQPLRLLVIGADQFALRATRRMRFAPLMPCCVIGYVRLPGQEVRVTDAKVYSCAEIASLDPSNIDDVLIAVPLDHLKEIPKLVRDVRRLCRPIRAMVDLGDDLVITERLWQFGRLQLLDLARAKSESLEYIVGKRGFDIVFASAALVILSPLMLLISAAIKLTSRGPVFFRQDRIGLNGRTFQMLKFRSMVVNESSASQHTFTGDPRITFIGSFLRRSSLDELPQFFNVLKGDMSVVGPRPELTFFVHKFRKEIPSYMTRHNIKCGMTGWAQVNGLRGSHTSIAKRVEYDVDYIRNWSLVFDLKIVAMTIASGMANKNAV
jgi:Undecaprenyl-phosphate glucose phosphotransferase